MQFRRDFAAAFLQPRPLVSHILLSILSIKASIKTVVHFCGTNKNFSYKYVYVTSNERTVSNYVQVAVSCCNFQHLLAATVSNPPKKVVQ